VIYGASWTIVAPALGWLGWLALAVVLATGRVLEPAAYQRVGIVAVAWGATMLGVWGWAEPGRDLVRVAVVGGGARFMERPGEPYPILTHAGWPWPGFEGNGNGAAPGYVSWQLGLDAWLFNWLVFLVGAGLVAHLVRVPFRRRSTVLLSLGCSLCSLLGGWRVASLFD
jgi:hypothetical protein